jgi:hypothetical protein
MHFNKFCVVGMSDERARRIENQDNAMLPRPLRLGEIAEIVEFEIGG